MTAAEREARSKLGPQASQKEIDTLADQIAWEIVSSLPARAEQLFASSE